MKAPNKMFTFIEHATRQLMSIYYSNITLMEHLYRSFRIKGQYFHELLRIVTRRGISIGNSNAYFRITNKAKARKLGYAILHEMLTYPYAYNENIFPLTLNKTQTKRNWKIGKVADTSTIVLKNLAVRHGNKQVIHFCRRREIKYFTAPFRRGNNRAHQY